MVGELVCLAALWPAMTGSTGYSSGDEARLAKQARQGGPRTYCHCTHELPHCAGISLPCSGLLESIVTVSVPGGVCMHEIKMDWMAAKFQLMPW